MRLLKSIALSIVVIASLAIANTAFASVDLSNITLPYTYNGVVYTDYFRGAQNEDGTGVAWFVFYNDTINNRTPIDSVPNYDLILGRSLGTNRQGSPIITVAELKTVNTSIPGPDDAVTLACSDTTFTSCPDTPTTSGTDTRYTSLYSPSFISSRNVLDFYGGPGVNGTGSASPDQNTNTRFISVQPAYGSTTNSTTVSASATVYFNDVEATQRSTDPLSFKVCGYFQTASPDPTISTAFNITHCSPILSSGQATYNLGTTTLPKGFTIAFFYLESSDFPGSTFPATVISTSTLFTVVGPSVLDMVYGSSTLATQYYLQHGTSSPDEIDCNLTQLGACFAKVLVPNPSVLAVDWETLKTGFLSKVPFGYATRFVTIMTNNATSSLPTISVPVRISETASTTINIDFNDMFKGGGNLLDSIRDPYYNKSVKDVTKGWIQLFVALSVIFIVVNDLLGLHKNR